MSNLITTQKGKTGPAPMPRFVCSAVGCDSIADHPVSGLCHMHYKRVQRTGSLEQTMRQRGTGTVTTHGYVAVAKDGKKKQAHVLIVESILGHALPPGAVVHHVNEVKTDNTPTNLVVCPSNAYHKLLHQRMDSLKACGNASHRKCPFCKQYSAPESMTHNKSSRYFYHAACKTSYNQLRKSA